MQGFFSINYNTASFNEMFLSASKCLFSTAARQNKSFFTWLVLMISDLPLANTTLTLLKKAAAVCIWY